MSWKWLGAALIIAGCGSFGFGMAFSQRREVGNLRQLRRILEYMECQLSYGLTPLPELCRLAGKEGSGSLKLLFRDLARELEAQYYPDVGSCMAAAVGKYRDLPESLRKLLKQLGRTLGMFDLPGQLRLLSSVKAQCDSELAALERNREVRLRSYQTLGLCTGTALAIVLL